MFSWFGCGCCIAIGGGGGRVGAQLLVLVLIGFESGWGCCRVCLLAVNGPIAGFFLLGGGLLVDLFCVVVERLSLLLLKLLEELFLGCLERTIFSFYNESEECCAFPF